jgi:hypothetical protein
VKGAGRENLSGCGNARPDSVARKKGRMERVMSNEGMLVAVGTILPDRQVKNAETRLLCLKVMKRDEC